MRIDFRTARAEDAGAAAELVHAAGPAALDYGFSAGALSSRQFLDLAFRDGRGFFGAANHTVAIVDGEVVGVCASYGREEYRALAAGLVAQVLRFYPWTRVAGVLARCLRLRTLMPPPDEGMHYVANLGVREPWRGRGIGRALVLGAQARARALGRTVLALDVADDNPRARALYESLGFSPRARHRMAGAPGKVPDSTRMAMAVGEGERA